MRQALLCAALAFTTFAGTGCATLLQGPKQEVALVTEPTAAGVEIDGVRVGHSPTTVRLKRGKTHIVKLSKPGYEDKILALNSSTKGGWVLLDVLCGLVPLVVDIATSNWESFATPMFTNLQAKAKGDSGAAIASADSAAAEPEPSAFAQTGQVTLKKNELTACVCDSCFVKGTVSVGWHKRDVSLRLYGPLHAGSDALGPFSKNTLSGSSDQTFYVQSDKGDVYRVRVEAVSNESARLEWVRL